MNKNEITELALQNQQKARKVIADSKVVEIWQSSGAKINLVGSLRTGLLMKHRDIDFHIYSPKLEIPDSFKAMTKLAENPRIKKIEYANLLDDADTCLEWHAWYEDDEKQLWQLDMMHIVKGSTYDGYFENVADRIAAIITQEQRDTVLELKYLTPDDVKIAGIVYYLAVMRDGIKNYNEFMEWREHTETNGIIEWCP